MAVHIDEDGVFKIVALLVCWVASWTTVERISENNRSVVVSLVLSNCLYYVNNCHFSQYPIQIASYSDWDRTANGIIQLSSNSSSIRLFVQIADGVET